jgi:phosphotransferase system HPr-like phosphotransfer protein
MTLTSNEPEFTELSPAFNDALLLSRDAAYADGIGTWGGIVLGYLESPTAYHSWHPADWSKFARNYKVPIYVANHTPEADADSCVQQLRALQVPAGSLIVIDMETRDDAYYVEKFYAHVRPANYKVLVYGSASSVFTNPACNGYWVAQYDGEPDSYYPQSWPSNVRAKQYASDVMLGTQYDESTWKAWTVNEMWR